MVVLSDYITMQKTYYIFHYALLLSLSLWCFNIVSSQFEVFLFLKMHFYFYGYNRNV